MDITVLDLSAYVGLVAVGAVTLNMLLGMLMALRYSPVRSWPHRKFNYFRLHNRTGYLALTLSILHALILLWNKSIRFRIIDLLYPVHSPRQPFENSIGAIAFYTLAIVVVTSYLRLQLGRRLWKAAHFTVYIAAGALFWHSLATDPGLTGSPVDWFDGGKLFIEMCLTLVIFTAVVRWRYSLK